MSVKEWREALSQISPDDQRWQTMRPRVEQAAKNIYRFLRSRDGRVALKLLEKSSETTMLQEDSDVYPHGYSVLLMTGGGICFQSSESTMGMAMTGEEPNRRFLLTPKELEGAVLEIVKNHHKPEWLLTFIKQKVSKLTRQILKKKKNHR